MKRRNTARSIQLALSTTPQIRGVLEAIAETGLRGKNPAEVAERLLSEKLVEMIRTNDPLLSLYDRDLLSPVRTKSRYVHDDGPPSRIPVHPSR